jgi:predicted enzyme related to lactoylglutathione lyase
MPRASYFEFYVDDPEEVTRFYTEVFGWEIEKWEGPFDYWTIKTGEEGEPGIDGGIMKRPEDQPIATSITMNVPDLDEYAGKVTASGGEIVVPKASIPGVGYMAYCIDTQGNVFGLMQLDPSVQ